MIAKVNINKKQIVQAAMLISVHKGFNLGKISLKSTIRENTNILKETIVKS